MHPGIDAEAETLRCPVFDPLVRRFADEIARREDGRIHLLSKLRDIAPVDKDDGQRFGHHQHTGRPGKSGGPGQAFGRFRNILSQILIRARNEHTVDPEFAEQAADRGDAGLAVKRRGLDLEGLKHGACSR